MSFVSSQFVYSFCADVAVLLVPGGFVCGLALSGVAAALNFQTLFASYSTFAVPSSELQWNNSFLWPKMLCELWREFCLLLRLH